ncbi:MAG: DMT family transporter [Pseudomonadota bacterium]
MSAPPDLAPSATMQQIEGQRARDAAARTRADNLTAAGWIVLSCLGATVMTVAIRMMSGDLDSRMIAFLRAALGLWIVAPWLLDGSWRALRFTRPGLHLFRGALMAAALNLGFFAIATLEMATATILFFLAPIFATALAGPMLGESVGIRRWGAVAAGFVGALIILRPGAGALEWGMLAAVGSAACFSISLLLSKTLGAVDGARSVLVSSTAVAAVLTLPIAAPVWSLPGALEIWAWLGVLVLSSSLRMYADIKGYAIGEAGFLAPFSYLRLLFVGAIGWALFAEIPDAYTWLGGGVIAGATLFIAYREARLNKRIGAVG